MESLNAVKPILMRLATRYLYQEKKRKKALDPVANFHIRNGAELYRLNWAADTCPARLKESFGIMVNYRYNMLLCDF
jgi:malonyl-CoA decarboxylase